MDLALPRDFFHVPPGYSSFVYQLPIYVTCLLTPFVALLLFATLVLLFIVIQPRVRAVVVDLLGHERDPGSRLREVGPQPRDGRPRIGFSLFEDFLRSLSRGGHGVVVEVGARGLGLLANLLAQTQMLCSHLYARGLPFVRRWILGPRQRRQCSKDYLKS
ncbi:uncharacterized protein DS421_11g332790 [Arachis hypogaea]|nr:uncharacterized protein DS421_11g332790 [Arachis hypogaea]